MPAAAARWCQRSFCTETRCCALSAAATRCPPPPPGPPGPAPLPVFHPCLPPSPGITVCYAHCPIKRCCCRCWASLPRTLAPSTHHHAAGPLPSGLRAHSRRAQDQLWAAAARPCGGQRPRAGAGPGAHHRLLGWVRRLPQAYHGRPAGQHSLIPAAPPPPHRSPPPAGPLRPIARLQ
jgi:hypothetical protein